MNGRLFKYIFITVFCLVFFAQRSDAQFKEGAFTQNYNEPGDTTGVADSVAKLFSFKEFFGGLSGKNQLKVGTMFAGSVMFPGTAQIYNKQYWKLPIIYGGLGALAGTGGYYLHRYNQSQKAYDNFMLQKTAFEDERGIPYPFNAPVLDTKAKTTGTWLLVGAGVLGEVFLTESSVSRAKRIRTRAGRRYIRLFYLVWDRYITANFSRYLSIGDVLWDRCISF